MLKQRDNTSINFAIILILLIREYPHNLTLATGPRYTIKVSSSKETIQLKP